MYLVVKKDTIICKAKNKKQAECIIATDKARALQKGYDTTSYKYGKIIFDGEVDCHCGWFRQKTIIRFNNNKIVTYVGELYRKDN